MDEVYKTFGEWLLKLPIWLAFVVFLIWALGKFGPDYLVKLDKVSKQFREKSEAIKNEYIAQLESERERKIKEIAELKARLKKEKSKKS